MMVIYRHLLVAVWRWLQCGSCALRCQILISSRNCPERELETLRRISLVGAKIDTINPRIDHFDEHVQGTFVLYGSVGKL